MFHGGNGDGGLLAGPACLVLKTEFDCGKPCRSLISVQAVVMLWSCSEAGLYRFDMAINEGDISTFAMEVSDVTIK